MSPDNESDHPEKELNEEISNAESQIDSAADGDIGEPAMAELVENETPNAEVVDAQLMHETKDTAEETKLLENIAAKGGAVGSFVLGVLAVIGSFVTSYSIINAVLGLLLGLWGLSSRSRRLAVIGLALSMLGMIFSAVQITDIIQWYLQARAEAAESAF